MAEADDNDDDNDNNNNNNEEEEEDPLTIGDWTAYQDDENRTYYYNSVTEETSWDVPPGFENVGNDAEGAVDDGVDEGDDAAVDNEGDNDEFAPSPPYAQTPPPMANDDDDDDDDGITQSPSLENNNSTHDNDDGITQSPDGITQSPQQQQREEEEEEEEEEAPEGKNIGRGWIAYQDDEGRTYYYNSASGETQWDRPDVGNADDGGGEYDEGGGDGKQQKEKDEEKQDEYGATPSGMSDHDDDDDDDHDDDNDDDENGKQGVGREATNEDATKSKSTTTTATTATATAAREKEDAATTTTTTTASKISKEEKEDIKNKDAKQQQQQQQQQQDQDQDQQKQDPAALSLRFLQQPDAIMEPTVLDHISTLANALGPEMAGPKAMKSLRDGYAGDTSMCGLMGLWLGELKGGIPVGGGGGSGGGGIGGVGGVGVGGAKNGHKQLSNNNNSTNNNNNNSSKNDRFQQGANAARDVAEEVINRLAKERFTKDGGDVIMGLSRNQVAFLDEMIGSERWRKLLIDLSATNNDSKLFMYCLQSISKKGHHREIANRINQSDYFGVFNSMLASELAIAGKIAVDGFSEEVSASIDKNKGQMGSLVKDLRRTCTSTSYTYLYAMEVLKELISRSKKELSTNGMDKVALKRAIRKWERLQEELEDEMLKPLATGTTFQRKRRIDVALTISDLFQRQRRRIDPTLEVPNDVNDPSTNTSRNSKNDLANVLDSALVGLLTKSSLGIPLDKEVAENMLKFAYGGSTDRIGDLLIEHPSAITSLLRNIFGAQRIRQLETRQKCSRLVALAVMASERAARSRDQISVDESDEDFLCQIILKGSQLCEQVENMVSFTVLDTVENTDGSVGRQLSSMCIKYPVIAQGVMIWAKEVASGSEFINTAGYPTISPCILSLARLVCLYHPLARPAVLDLALIFLGHSNREISHQKMQSIKEQCLRLMLWMSTQGLSLAVISALQNKLHKGGTSEIDSALIRYFVSGMLDIVQPPLSLPFVQAFGSFLMERPCMNALQSQHFEARRKAQIVKLMKHFDAALADSQILTDAPLEDDSLLVSTLKSTYSSAM